MILGTEKRTGLVILLNDSRVMYITQLYENNDINQPENGVEIVLKEGGRKVLEENLSDIESTTRTSRWLKVTRESIPYLLFRDNVLQLINNPSGGSTIEFQDSFGRWVVDEDVTTINNSTGGGGGSDVFISNIQYVQLATGWKLRATYSNGNIVDYDTPDDFVSERIGGLIRVAKNGNDADALAAAVTVGGLTIFDWHTPFANPAVAQENAIAGEHSVIVEPGTYTIGTVGSGADLVDNGTRYIVRNGVPLLGKRGAIIEYLSDSSTINYVEDNGNPANFIIRGNLIIRFSRSLDSSRGVNNDRTIIDWEFDRLETSARLRWQVFDTLRMIGIVQVTANRAFLSTRNVTAFVPQSTRKKIILKGDEFTQTVAASYDQLELAYLENCDLTVDYKRFNWISGSGGCVRLRAVRESTNVSINFGNVLNLVNSNQPFLFLESDDSRGTINIDNIDIAGRVLAQFNTIDPIARINKTITINGRVRDGNANFISAVVFNNANGQQIQANLNMTVEDTVGNHPNGGVLFFRDSPNVCASGYVSYGNPNHTIVRVSPFAAGPEVQGFIKNLIMSSTGCPSCIENSSTTLLARLKVLSSASNVGVSTSNGNVNQLVDTVIIEPAI